MRRIYICAAAALLLCGCSSSSSQDDNGAGLAIVDNGGASYRVSVPACEYPEFLKDIKDPDNIMNKSRVSFESSMVTEVTTQPFDNYECTYTYPGSYIYKENGFEGVLDSDGAVLIAADTFARAEFVSPVLLKMYLYDYSDDYVIADISDKNKPEIIDNYKFSSSRIKTVARKPDDSDKVLTYLQVNGTDVGSSGYDSVQQKDTSELPDSISCKRAYTVTKDGAYYIITFDEYYNYTVYEGTYSKVSLNIDGQAGSCNIMSFDDDLEAKSLIDSFAKMEDTLEKKDDEDFISFDFGIYGEDSYVVTLYESGKYISQGEKNGEEFYESAKVDKRCFADLVKWVDTVVSLEYVKEEKSEQE